MAYEPTFSPRDFFEHGSSLWRWVKYGHGKTPFVNPFSRESLTAPCAPRIKNRIEKLMLHPQELPAEFRLRAKNFSLLSVNIPRFHPGNGYPGDGYLFFTDHYFSRYYFRFYTDKVIIDFFNYIYSFRHLMSPALFSFFSELYYDSTKIYLYYPYRSLIFGDTSYFDEYKLLCNKSNFQKRLEIAFLERIFGHSLHELAYKIDIPIFRFLSYVYQLLEGLTPNAVKRILFNSQATRRSIIGARNLVNDTINLINHNLPQKYQSVRTLKTFHDDQMEYINRKIIEKKINPKSKYAWDDRLVKIINSVSEDWYIPKTLIEIVERGKRHHNCVGLYTGWHFCSPDASLDNETFSKTLILLSKEAEAELRLFFKKKKVKNTTGKIYEKTLCTSCYVVQCRTKYNRSYPQDIPDRLCEKFINCDISLFVPVRKE